MSTYPIVQILQATSVAWKGDQEVRIASNEIERLNRDNPKKWKQFGYAEEYGYWLELSDKGSDKVAKAVQIGVFVPIGFLILSPFGWFIYRGFKPKLPSQSM